LLSSSLGSCAGMFIASIDSAETHAAPSMGRADYDKDRL
jgi:hypothetical protein